MRGRSKAAVALTAVYLLLALVAALPLVAKEGDSLAGIFLVVFALPWSVVLGALTDRFGIESIAFNYVFLLLGVFIDE